MTTLRTTAEGCGNIIVEGSILKIADSVERGSDLSSTMTHDALFPPMLVEMVAAGELTGRVPEMMEQVAGHYEAEVETMLNGLTSMVEPLLIMVLGTIVGTIVLCMFLPIFKLSEIVAF